MYLFKAHKNGQKQFNCLHGAYTTITWQATERNDGGYFDLVTGLWTPPEGYVLMTGTVWFSNNFAPSPATCVMKVYKNGNFELPSGGAMVGWVPAAFPQTAASGLPGCWDWANGTDTYEVRAHGRSVNGIDDLAIDGHPNHTWWSGMSFAP